MITGVVMVGGQSRRMGRDKSAMVVDGITLAERALVKLGPWCGQVVFSGSPSCHPGSGHVFVEDILPGMGPLGGLYSVMKAVPSPHYLLLAVDMPEVPSMLLEALSIHPFQGCVVPRDAEGRLEPLVARYPSTLLPAIESALEAGELALHRLFNDQNTHFLDYQNYGIIPYDLLNLNEPGEWKAYRDKRKS